MSKKTQLSDFKTDIVVDDGSATTLHIGEEQIVIASRRGSESAPQITLPIGSIKTAGLFKHNPPTEAEMEYAIMLVEDELFQIRHLIVKESTLSTTDASIRTIARIAGMPDQPSQTLTRDLIEQTFNRLAAIVQGRPASQDAIPTTAEFSATLLILREFMHHLNFASIDIRP